MKYIDINADLGEGMGNDSGIMPYISSCSIACGGHFGDQQTIGETIKLAKHHGVKVGAHPSFPDKDNFGRKLMTLTKNQLTEAVLEQLLTFYEVANREVEPVHHIKLHGALYNYAAKDAPCADAVIDAILTSKMRPNLYVPFGSVLHRKAENLLPLTFEAFIDRGYNDDLSLVSRNEEDAVIKDAKAAWKQLYHMVELGEVKTRSSVIKTIIAQTFCIHGDNEEVLSILKYIQQQMKLYSIAFK